MNEENNMIFDTDTFDFFSLTDIKEEHSDPDVAKLMRANNRPTVSAEDVKRMPLDIPEDEGEGFTLFDEDEEQNTPFDPNKDTSDLIGNSFEQQEEANQQFHTLEDWAVIDLGDVKLTKADTIELARNKQRINEEKAFYDAVSKADYEQLYNHIADSAIRFQTETEKTIEAINNALESPLTPAHEKGELYDRLLKEKAKFALINKNVQETVQARQTQEAALTRYRIENTRNAMKAKYGDKWTKEAGDVFNYAIQNGISENMIARNLDPSLAEMFLKARAYDIEMNKRKAKTKAEIDQSWARSKATAQASKKTQSVSSREAYLRHKSNTDGLTPEENREMFNYLKD